MIASYTFLTRPIGFKRPFSLLGAAEQALAAKCVKPSLAYLSALSAAAVAIALTVNTTAALAETSSSISSSSIFTIADTASSFCQGCKDFFDTPMIPSCSHTLSSILFSDSSPAFRSALLNKLYVARCARTSLTYL